MEQPAGPNGFAAAAVYRRLSRSLQVLLDRLDRQVSREGAVAIGTQHLLLGLIEDQGGLAWKILAGFGLERSEVQESLNAADEAGRAAVEWSRFPYTPVAAQALSAAGLEADALGHKTVEEGHLLLALLRLRDAAAEKTMLGLGAMPQDVRSEIQRHLSLAPAGPGTSARP